MTSDDIVIQAPMSYTGASKRIWKITRSNSVVLRWLLLIPVAVVLVALALIVVTCWYVVFGILLVPYRLLRRGSRKRKREEMRHQEVLAAARRSA